jgi:hypothetical protein
MKLVVVGDNNRCDAVMSASRVGLGHSAMSAQCPVCPKADVDPRIVMSQMCQKRL